jgi:hypothetical protein
MNNFLDRWRDDTNAVTLAKQKMIDALARLGKTRPAPASAAPVPPRKGRLVMIIDLTGSREPSLEEARKATAAMIDTIKAVGAIAVKLIYFRGDNECKASPWHDHPDILRHSMQGLSCKTGGTQIARALRVVLAEKETVSGVVYIGDCCEDEPEELDALAQALGARSVPLYMFHEIGSLEARPVFRGMAEASKGVYVEFRPDAGKVLREILANVAAFVTAGPAGVRQIAAMSTTPEARQLQARLLLPPG